MWITEAEIWDALPDHTWLKRFCRFGAQVSTEPVGHWLVGGLVCLSQLTSTAIHCQNLRIIPSLMGVMLRRGRSTAQGMRVADMTQAVVEQTFYGRTVVDPTDINAITSQLYGRPQSLLLFNDEIGADLLARANRSAERILLQRSMLEAGQDVGVVVRDTPGRFKYTSVNDSRCSVLFRVRARSMVPAAWQIRGKSSTNIGGGGALLAHALLLGAAEERRDFMVGAHTSAEIIHRFQDLAAEFNMARSTSMSSLAHKQMQDQLNQRMAASFKGLNNEARVLYGAFSKQSQELMEGAEHPAAVSRLNELVLRVAYLLTLDGQATFISNDQLFDRPWHITAQALDVAIRFVNFSARTVLKATDLQEQDEVEELSTEVLELIGSAPTPEGSLCGGTGRGIRIVRKACARLLEDNRIQQAAPGDLRLGDRDEAWFVKVGAAQPQVA